VKKLCGIFLVITVTCSFGCAGPGSNTVAGNVATGAAINALAGVPGAGIVGLAAMVVDAATKPSAPKGGKASPELRKMIMESPTCNIFCKHWKERPCKPEELEVFWVTRKEEGGRVVSKETAPRRSMEYTEAFRRATYKYMAGILGDTPEMQAKNQKAREEGRLVVAAYSGPNNTNLVFVSRNKDEVADAMLAEEWAARKDAGDSERIGVAQEPVNAPTDQNKAQPPNAKN